MIAATQVSGPGPALVPSPGTPGLNLAPYAGDLQQLHATRAGLKEWFLERDAAVDMLFACLLAQEHILFIGKPGTGKSALINALAQSVQVRVFYMLMNAFTQPEELVGPISVSGLKNDQYRRIPTNRLPEAEIADLDEPFRATSQVMNTLLTISNERVWDNGGVRVPVPLMILTGGSNSIPTDESMEAMWDRYFARFPVKNVSQASQRVLWERQAGHRAYPAPVPMLGQAPLQRLQALVDQVIVPVPVLDALERLFAELLTKGIEVSTRRWNQVLHFVRAVALADGCAVVDEDHLLLLEFALWANVQQRANVHAAIAEQVRTLVGQAVEQQDAAHSVYEKLHKDLQGLTGPAKSQAAFAAVNKIKDCAAEVEKLLTEAVRRQRDPTKIQRVLDQIELWREEAAILAVGRMKGK